MKTIYIKEFSKFPGPRYISLGEFSGEEFRDEYLIPALEKYDEVTVNLDGVFGYGSSFLEEAFGGLVRKQIEKSKIISLKNNLISTDASIIDEINIYIDEALQLSEKK
ncbi:TPA: STAS-like domain-containing protein [Yersinia enterocolitica]